MSRAFERLAPLAAKGMVLGLDSMRDALRAWGDPHLRIPCAHVAGTNGKGSVSALLDAALLEARLEVLVKGLGPSACPPYRIVCVLGGLSPEEWDVRVAE